MIKQVLLSLPLLMMVACGTKEPENTPDNNQPANNETDNGSASNGSESNGADGNAADNHGKEHPLTKVKLREFGRLIKITQLGEIEAGKEGAVMIAFNISAERISNVRAWIGIEGGSGSVKAKLDIEGDTKMHGHVEVPKPIPAESKWWFTFEADGKTETISTAYK
jgi:hypothetical protein